MEEMFTPEGFTEHFFGHFGSIMIHGDPNIWTQDHSDEFWRRAILGIFYVLPSLELPNLDQTKLPRPMFPRL
jgi:hypothetical protein